MVEAMLDMDAEPLPVLTLRAETWELHIRAPLADFSRLTEIRDAHWDERRSLRIGVCAGSSVFWALSDDRAVLLIGQDDETWDIALTIPLATVDEIAALAHVF
ncbi:hypothetical protein [Actinomadura opuntiae]|uniref:hypothetical protein n=1 Tax=Actinomadura sp. OS1-43 TaxID=604315 RepID=UPI00255A9E8E|nr:hypothetical protein [Actinomadura sp. OS1-43]MDL4820949.1 hypothetical protein [Actinomadura sp. OS1-43]